ncbi:MAG: leucine-rich repeat domain-containing protein [Promethearchaeota archaeon]
MIKSPPTHPQALGGNKIMIIIHGIELVESDAAVLKELEQCTMKELKPISIIDIEHSLTGFSTVNGRVTGLGLFACFMSSLPERIGQLSSLEILNLQNTSISSIPESIGQLSMLRELDLSDNNLTSLPETIGKLLLLQRLDLGNNDLTSLPETLGSLSSLQELLIGSNPLKSLPDTISNLSMLNFLSINDVPLISLPDSLGQLSNLEFLDLTANQLSSLPETMGSLSSLKELHLENNQLSSLPETMGSLSSLKELFLQQNPLAFLPDSFGALTSLEYLNLNQCKFEKIPSAVRTMSNLTTLYLNENSLVSEDVEMIKNEIPTIQEFLRKRADIHIFLSYAIEPATTMLIPKIAKWLEQQDEIYKVWYYERDIMGDIDGETERIISSSQIFLFLATKRSIHPESDSRFEIAKAKKNMVEIIPIKTREVGWGDLAEVGLDRQLGKELMETEGPVFETFRQELYDYILQYKREHDLFDPEKRELDIIKTEIQEHYLRFEENELFDRRIVENIEGFKSIDEEFETKKAPEIEIYSKLFDLLLRSPKVSSSNRRD